MSKVVKLTESDLENIVKKVIKEQETQEGVFDPVVDTYQGIKGAFKGEGYDYFKYLSSLRGLTKKLKQADIPNKKLMNSLLDLRLKVEHSRIPFEKKNDLKSAIDSAMGHFEAYSNLVDTIEKLVSQKTT